jgi:CRP-like cAMP-binding protein
MLARSGATFAIIRPEVPAERYTSAILTTLDLMPVRQRAAWLRRFVVQGEVVEYYPGAMAVAEGDRADAWYLLLHGEADVLVGGKRVGGLSAHAFFGELALLGNGSGVGTRRATIRAKTPLVCLRIPADVFRDFVVAEDLVPYFEQFWNRVGTLKRAQLFMGFPHEVIEDLVGRVQSTEFAPTEILLAQGDIGDWLYVIQSGTVEVVRATADGTELIATLDEVASVVGEYGVRVPGGKRTATVRAVTPVTALKLTRSDLDAVLAGQLPLQLRITAMLERRGIATVTMPAVTTA